MERVKLCFRHYMSQNQGHDASETPHGSAETPHASRDAWDVSLAPPHAAPENAPPPLSFARRAVSSFFGKTTIWPVDTAPHLLPIKIAIFAFCNRQCIFSMKPVRWDIYLTNGAQEHRKQYKELEMKENGCILIYTDGEGRTKIDVKLEEDTLWLTQAQMCELYQTSKSNVSEHIRHIFEEGELQEDAVVRKFRTTASDGKSYLTTFYGLDMIIALGYRVRSIIATRFRQWATQRLKEYMIKGFTLDDERLKQLGGGGYWKELLERIRDIRATEKVFYRQILEIYATSIDYDPRASVSQEFFKKVQNKIHYAIHGHTAAELIVERADAEKNFMGLLTFKGNQPTLVEARTAKNYLDEKELRAMGQLVSGYLDFAERQAEREQPMTMNDWANYLDRILTMSGEQLLRDGGRVSHAEAMEHATNEYRKYKQRTLSDVEKDYLDAIKRIGNIRKKGSNDKD